MSIENEIYLINKYNYYLYATFADNFYGFIKIGTYAPHVNESQGMGETILHTRNNV
jgi:hypothetical protein